MGYRHDDDNHYNFHHFGAARPCSASSSRALIVRNFQDGQWTPEQVTAIDAKTFAESPYRQKMDGCYACSVRCKKRAKDEAMGVEPRYGGPEYETLGATGTNLQVDDLPILLRINQRLNRVGIDSVSFGATVAWAMECYERGLLADADRRYSAALGDGRPS